MRLNAGVAPRGLKRLKQIRIASGAATPSHSYHCQCSDGEKGAHLERLMIFRRSGSKSEAERECGGGGVCPRARFEERRGPFGGQGEDGQACGGEERHLGMDEGSEREPEDGFAAIAGEKGRDRQHAQRRRGRAGGEVGVHQHERRSGGGHGERQRAEQDRRPAGARGIEADAGQSPRGQQKDEDGHDMPEEDRPFDAEVEEPRARANQCGERGKACMRLEEFRAVGIEAGMNRVHDGGQIDGAIVGAEVIAVHRDRSRGEQREASANGMAGVMLHRSQFRADVAHC